jgi:hypothetical protein
MSAKNGRDDSNECEDGDERSALLTRMSLEELLYYVLVEPRGNGPNAAAV